MANADRLSQIGNALYGTRWQTQIAHDLGVTPRQVRRWAAGANMPASAWHEMHKLMRARIVRLAHLLDTP